MLDIKLIRENPELVRKNLERRNQPEYLKLFDELLEKDKVWRETVLKANELRKERNKLTKEIANLRKEGKDFSQQIEKAKKIDKELE